MPLFVEVAQDRQTSLFNLDNILEILITSVDVGGLPKDKVTLFLPGRENTQTSLSGHAAAGQGRAYAGEILDRIRKATENERNIMTPGELLNLREPVSVAL